MVSKYTSISEMFVVLWLIQSDTKIDDSNKRRKLGSEIGEKQMYNYGWQVYDYVCTSICAENESPSMYIKAGVKYSTAKSTELS